MNVQRNSIFLQLLVGQAHPLGRSGGELTVLQGRLWLTRAKVPGDHFVDVGETVRLGAGEDAVIEPAESGRGATLRWTPRRQVVGGHVLAAALLGVAFTARALAAGFGALARTAAARACRAQGSIEPGESSASSGALK